MKKTIIVIVAVILIIIITFLGYWFFLRKNCNQFSGNFSWAWGPNLVSKCENAGCKTNIKNCSGSQDAPDSVMCYLECTSK